MMNFNIILCIVSTVMSLHTEACSPSNLKYSLDKTINEIGLAMKNLSDFTGHLKINLDMKLEGMKASETFNISMIGLETIIYLTKLNSEMSGPTGNKKNDEYFERLAKDVLNSSMKTSDEFKKCVGNQHDIFNTVDRHIQDFFDDRKLCLLDSDTLMAKICLTAGSETSEECIRISNNTNPSTLSSLPCDSDSYAMRQKSLENDAQLSASLGELLASLCIQSHKKKFNVTMEKIKTLAAKYAVRIM